MKVGSWNIRGLNKGLKQKGVENLFQMDKLAVLGVLETKLTDAGYQKLKSQRFQQFQVEQQVISDGRSRILLVWDDHKVNLELGYWHTSDEYEGIVREVTFRSLCHSPLCPPDTAVTERQRAFQSYDNTSLVFETVQKAHDVPFGSYFEVLLI
ncbi:hypothetical protein ZIOFF_030762 [Zingiber officinale]|uniref:VASt domain-containing protein n=1 Tax=Zingiber officinale TaxID=94328 RepID=A0A8J5LFE6_ZINOF|nr:hypothetical protein ZIOFF_030762 [Zingiber officinale]